MIIEDLKTLATDIGRLSNLPDNPRKGNVDAVANSLATFGQRKPIIARRKDGVVIAGNHTLQAARQLGWTEIAVVWVDDDEITAKAFALADNRTAELGTYDDELLADMILAVQKADAELLAMSGWDNQAVQDLLYIIEADQQAPEVPASDPEPGSTPPPSKAPALTVAGDVWLLGPHRLMCGDSRVPTDVDRLLAGSKINLAFTSPPYAEQRTYDESSGFKPISPDEYVEWFQMVQANVKQNLTDDGSWFVNIKPSSEGLDTFLYVFDLVIAHVRQWGWHFGTEYCWERNGMPKQVTLRFKNQYEPIYHFALNRWKFRPDNVQHFSKNVPIPAGPGVGATTRSNKQGGNGAVFGAQIKKRKNGTSEFMADHQGEAVAPGEYITEGMAYPGNRLPTFSESHEATGHTAAFPVGLPEWFVKAYTDEGDTVYDPFMGSGSTLLAAHQQNRVAYGMEISPAYCDIICRRWQRHTGIKPIAEATGNEHDFDLDE